MTLFRPWPEDIPRSPLSTRVETGLGLCSVERVFSWAEEKSRRLARLESHLSGRGYDSFLAVHRGFDGKDLSNLSPREKTLRLAGSSDLNLFVFTITGIRNGLVAELTETQSRFPELSWKHVVLLEEGLRLSSILDESQGGVLPIRPIKQLSFQDDEDLLKAAEQVAFNYAWAKKAGTQP